MEYRGVFVSLNNESIKSKIILTKEYQRLVENDNYKAHWRRWGPYLSERQWGTVREDYSFDGNAWSYLSHDAARSHVYRWGEDGIAGISDNHQRLCFALSLWNTKDPILKERLFGLTGQEGNHGEDVKEYYYYLDNTPTHSYMKCLYKYPQYEYPYNQLIDKNRIRTRSDPEFELIDTGIFDENKYFDVFVEYAKKTDRDILIKITIINRGPVSASLHILPTLWFRNTWAWNQETKKPNLSLFKETSEYSIIEADHPSLEKHWLYFVKPIEVLFTENETNYERLYNYPNKSPYVKDSINNYIVNGNKTVVNPSNIGTKVAIHYLFDLKPNQTVILKLRLADSTHFDYPINDDFETVFNSRIQEADEFYSQFLPTNVSNEIKQIQRQAFAGMLWSKQFYHYIIETWLHGDPNFPKPPAQRLYGRNHEWEHMYADDILSMPDKWEYPWFAAWDTAFHLIPLVMIDPEFAKKQLLLLTREWYMHPNGQIPAYEYNFSDVNPPVHAMAAWKIYILERKLYGKPDKLFLERVFQKLLLNFTWWVNRKDSNGKNIFQGGFLGLDNIGVFDRSKGISSGGSLEQADATGWMAKYCLNMLKISLELAVSNPAYEDIATKFFEHFLYIAHAMENLVVSGDESGLWDDEDEFFYDTIHLPDGKHLPLKVRSMVGIIPLFAVEVIDDAIIAKLPDFNRRMTWFLKHRKDLTEHVLCSNNMAVHKHILSIVTLNRLKSILKRLFDENEFLGPYGIRSLSKYYEEHPYEFDIDGNHDSVAYEPAESTIPMFGGNSNWRGPIWFPLNFLIIDNLEKFSIFLGDDFKIEYPTRSNHLLTLKEIVSDLIGRLLKIFLVNNDGNRPVFGKNVKIQNDPHWKNYLWFYEYFNGNNGTGLGASHQTGWTGVITYLIQKEFDMAK